jgi:hypothetical protein
MATDEKPAAKSAAPKPAGARAAATTPTIDRVSESNDPSVNPQAQAPGNVVPERTPGSAPSVVPLPDGADPSAKPGEHPLPEDAIDGYPPATQMQKESDAAAAADKA